MLKLNKTIKFYTVIKMEEGFSVFIKIIVLYAFGFKSTIEYS